MPENEIEQNRIIFFPVARIRTYVRSPFLLLMRLLLLVLAWFAVVEAFLLLINIEGSVKYIMLFILVLIATLIFSVYIFTCLPFSDSISLTFECREGIFIIRSVGHKYSKERLVDGVYYFNSEEITEVEYNRSDNEAIIKGPHTLGWISSGDLDLTHTKEIRKVKKEEVIISFEENRINSVKNYFDEMKKHVKITGEGKMGK